MDIVKEPANGGRQRLRPAQDGSPVRGGLGRVAARRWVWTWLGLGILLIGSIVSSATPPVASAGPLEERQPVAPVESSQPTTAFSGQLWASNKRSFKKGSSPSPHTRGSGGESEAARLGRQAHRDWEPGEGFEKEAELPSGKRADAVNWDKREVKELKPDKTPSCNQAWRATG